MKYWEVIADGCILAASRNGQYLPISAYRIVAANANLSANLNPST